MVVQKCFDEKYQELVDKINEQTIPIGAVTVSEMIEELTKMKKRGLGNKPIIDFSDKKVITIINNTKDKVWYHGLNIEDL